MSNAIDLKKLLIEDLKLRPDECLGKTVVVTGGGQGIGLQIARAFGLLGGKVVIAEISPQTGQAAEAQIRGEGGQVLFVETDVSDEESVRKLASAARTEFGGVAILINNAIRCPAVAVLDMDVALWDSVIAVNLRGTFLTCKAFLPEMLDRRQGVILNLVSTDAMPGLAAYIASKQGINGFSQSLALETGPGGVKVIPFGPGMVDTPGIRGVAGDLAPRLGLSQEQFLGLSLHAAYQGLMPAEHAGAAAVYLALRLADEFHGQAVNGYEVLERVGLLKTSPIEVGPSQPAAAASATNLKERAGQLRQIMEETGLEFEKLPVFIRPIARSGFKTKAGMSLDDWKRRLADLENKANRFTPGEYQTWIGQLEKLTTYYRGVPAETGRFTRDVEMLRQVAELCAQRIKVIEELKAALAVGVN